MQNYGSLLTVSVKLYVNREKKDEKLSFLVFGFLLILQNRLFVLSSCYLQGALLFGILLENIIALPVEHWELLCFTELESSVGDR